MAAECPDFVKWREEFVSQERGSRVVHYYLDDAAGVSYLASVGTERSVRHMFYVVDEEFARVYASKRPGLSGLRWRSRREVVQWLSSFLPRQPKLLPQHPQSRDSNSDKTSPTNTLGANMTGYRQNYPESHNRSYKDHLDCHRSDFIWSGTPWSCGKQLRHYRAFGHNGTIIATHSFVLVKSEEESSYLAYVEDMYEDKKGQKKVKVRWFYRSQEFGFSISRPSPHPREVFPTPRSQVISAESVDDLAGILTPDHYEKCLAKFPNACSARVYLCHRQYIKNRFKPFDVSTLRGYFDQAVVSCLDICSVCGEEHKELAQEPAVRCGGPKRIRCVKGNQILTDNFSYKVSGCATNMMACAPTNWNLRYGLNSGRPLSIRLRFPCLSFIIPFKVNERIELLCQDSGVRGCWFQCTVLQLSQKQLRVRYDDVENADSCGNLEEWVPAVRLAAPDKLGMRCSGRLTIRPHPMCGKVPVPDDAPLQIGDAVDAWRGDGWWEGVIIGVDSCGSNFALVYFPGEDLHLTCWRKNLRVSKDWVENRWVDIKSKPDVLSAISNVSLKAKLIATKEAESGSSAMCVAATEAISTESAKQAVTCLSGGAAGLLKNIEQTDLNIQSSDGVAEETGN